MRSWLPLSRRRLHRAASLDHTFKCSGVPRNGPTSTAPVLLGKIFSSVNYLTADGE
jgi:hypothetical protein